MPPTPTVVIPSEICAQSAAHRAGQPKGWCGPLCGSLGPSCCVTFSLATFHLALGMRLFSGSFFLKPGISPPLFILSY